MHKCHTNIPPKLLFGKPFSEAIFMGLHEPTVFDIVVFVFH